MVDCMKHMTIGENSKSIFKLELEDTEWQMEYIDHDREIARAIVFDTEGYYYYGFKVCSCRRAGCQTSLANAGRGLYGSVS